MIQTSVAASLLAWEAVIGFWSCSLGGLVFEAVGKNFASAFETVTLIGRDPACGLDAGVATWMVDLRQIWLMSDLDRGLVPFLEHRERSCRIREVEGDLCMEIVSGGEIWSIWVYECQILVRLGGRLCPGRGRLVLVVEPSQGRAHESALGFCVALNPPRPSQHQSSWISQIHTSLEMSHLLLNQLQLFGLQQLFRHALWIGLRAQT